MRAALHPQETPMSVMRCDHGWPIDKCIECAKQITYQPFVQDDTIKDVPSEKQLGKVAWWAMVHMFDMVRQAGKLDRESMVLNKQNTLALSFTMQHTKGHKHDCVAVAVDQSSETVTVTSNTGIVKQLGKKGLQESRTLYGPNLVFKKVSRSKLAELQQRISGDLGLESPKVHAELQLVQLGYLNHGETLGIERLCCLSCAAQLIVLGRGDTISGCHGMFFDDAAIIPLIYEDGELLRALIGPRAYGYISRWERAAIAEFLQAICRPTQFGIQSVHVWRYFGIDQLTETTHKSTSRKQQQGKGDLVQSDTESMEEGF
jgi:hypothetical protein